MALAVALVYATAGALWILFSDTAVDALVGDPGHRSLVQHVKGGAYVAVTAILLYVVLQRHRSRVAARDRRLRAVLESMADGIVVVDRAGRIVDANGAAARIVGLSPHESTDLDFAEQLRAARARHADGRPLRVEETAIARALRGETVDGVEALVRGPDGHDAFVSVSAAPVPGHDGLPELAVASMRDVSEVKRFEQMREEFMATAAHELKTPLAVVKAYAQLLQRRAQGDPAALAAISRQADRLNRIVQQLLDVSRFRVGGGELRRERFDLGLLAQHVAADMEHSAGGRIVVERAPDAAVLADRERIAQVVASLMENALRFSPDGGAVEAAVARRDHEAVLSVRDRGVGIPPERQARIFERYYRAHQGTAHDYGGLGLGLDVAREIVARHGGRIWFESEPGQGSTFSFALPLAPAELPS